MRRLLLRTLSLFLASGVVAACARTPSEPPPAATVEAKEGETTLVASLDRITVEVGQPIRLTLTTTSPDGNVVPPALPEKLGPFEVRPVLDRQQGSSDPRVRRKVFELTTLEAGSLEVPAIDLPLGSGDDAPQLRAAAMPVTVASLIGEDSDPSKFKDIKGALDLTPREIPWPLVAGAFASFAALAVILWFAFFHRRGERAEAALAPDAWALRELDRLAKAGLLAAGRVHDFHVLLTDIVRGYVERRYGIRAPELTTQEFLREAKRSTSIDEAHQVLLGGFLRQADLVKFAGVRPANEDSEKAIATARTFVTESRPREGSTARSGEAVPA